MGSMISIYEIMNGNPNWLEIKFKKYNQSFILDELYCINPRCDCQNVRLHFLPLNGNKTEKKIVGFVLNLNTYKITNIDIDDPSYDFAYLVSEFTQSLQDFIDQFRENYQKAKQYGLHHLSEQVTTEEIEEGLKNGFAFGYSELNLNNNPIELIYNQERFIIDDHYCIDPNCQCEEAILHFIRVNPLLNQYEVEFSVHYHFKTNRYHFNDDSKVQNKNSELVMQHVMRNRKDLLDLFKIRYQEMKTKGQLYSQNKNKTIKSSKVGRNEPCPCGSGKKYKQCCGKNNG